MADIAQAFDAGVGSTTQEDYCVKQVARGLSGSECARRFAMWQARSRGKGQKMQQNWASGKGSYGGR